MHAELIFKSKSMVQIKNNLIVNEIIVISRLKSSDFAVRSRLKSRFYEVM